MKNLELVQNKMNYYFLEVSLSLKISKSDKTSISVAAANEAEKNGVGILRNNYYDDAMNITDARFVVKSKDLVSAKAKLKKYLLTSKCCWGVFYRERKKKV